MTSYPNKLLPLKGRQFSFPILKLSEHYAAQLLQSLGAVVGASVEQANGDCLEAAAIDWAESGLMPLTGYAAGPPMQGPGAIASAARGALDVLRLLSRVQQKELPAELDGAKLLSERAAFLHLRRSGACSPNGSCQLLKAKDGWVALNLAREDDWDLLPAWLEVEGGLRTWASVEASVKGQAVEYLVERGRLMGLPLCSTEVPLQENTSWFSVYKQGKPATVKGKKSPLVIDLSSLWAGPLCSHLLMHAGARVIKVESKKRPDGARRGNKDFYDLLNGGKQSVALDLSNTQGKEQLIALIGKADIVIEGSRPRALKQLGIDAELLLDKNPGLVWVSITGYGRQEPQANWVAFGDDAAVAAGVAQACANPPIFCGDALADPLTGLHAAVAALAFWQKGGGVLLGMSLRKVTAHCLGYRSDVPLGQVRAIGSDWQLAINERIVKIEKPAPRQLSIEAAELGSDTQTVLKEFEIPC